MAENTDVAELLASGRPVVDTIAEYVWACRLLGYQHQDLTGHARQVHEWYDTETGLNLRAIDTERAAFTAAAAAVEPALHLHDSQFRVLSESWQGAGAQASRDFLQRHGAAAGQAVTALRAAATTLAQLGDDLRRAVERKVAATQHVEDRQAAQRGAWLAAARTVTTGLGDRSTASELIDQQVKPFVDNAIAGEWLAEMRAATTAVADAYDAAVTALRSGPVPVFDIPGDLGPAWSPSPRADADLPAPAGRSDAPTVPAGFTATPAGAPAWSPPPTWTAPPPASPAAMPASAVPPPAVPAEPMAPPPGLGQTLGAGLPGAGGGLSDMGSGLAGTGQQLADLFGGLIGSAAEGLPDGETLAEEPLDLAEDEPDEDGEQPDPKIDDEDEDQDDDEEGTGATEDEPAEESPEVPAQPDEDSETVEPPPVSPEPTGPPPPVAEPAAEPLAAPAGDTPCEIAADELPQVGP